MAVEATENGAADAEAVERRPTERVILERRRVLVVPDGVTEEQLEAAAKALSPRKGKGVLVSEAWEEVSRQTGNKTAAIELYAGKAGTPDARVGEWRAPSVTAWKGGVRHSAPPLPLIEREVIE